uniref:phage tail-collar fiber domain-containing protein n=1 Tax=Enterobacter agglomerans TaxID=549 RepID=UPI003AFFF2F0
MADYYTLLTNAGIAYETACKAAGVPIKLTQISVGDGGGAAYNPAATATALKRE